jgi:hypothetical protein
MQYAHQMGVESSLNRESARLMSLLQGIAVFADLKGPVLWLDHETPYERHPNLPSLRNLGEAQFAARIACAMGDAVGDGQIAVIAPYKFQVFFMIGDILLQFINC